MNSKDFSPKQRNFYKRNYIRAMEIITPQFYREEDIRTNGTELDPLDDIANTFLKYSLIAPADLNISATTNFPDLNTAAGISPYFIKQNRLTHITPFEFQRDILSNFNSLLSDFQTSSQFQSYLQNTVFPTIIADQVASEDYEYYVNALSWLQFLNTTDSSSIAVSILTDRIFNGKDVRLVDCMVGLAKHIHENHTYLLSEKYRDNLPAVITLTELLFSPLEIDSKDFYLKEAFDNFISTNSELISQEGKGPLSKFLRALSFKLADISDEVEKISLIYDVDQCPAEYLPFVAELIGWKLFGYNPERWRLQIKNAVRIYKSKGTKKSIQVAVDSIFAPDVFDISSRITELYESYIPNLIWYALGTESPYFKSLETWTVDLVNKTNVRFYDNKSLDNSIKYVVDHIILDLFYSFPTAFRLKGIPFDPPRFIITRTGEPYNGPIHVHAGPKFFTGLPNNHEGEQELSLIGNQLFVFKNRSGGNSTLPQFEDERFYKECDISPEMVERIVFQLKCFGVRPEFADEVGNYITQNLIVEDDNLKVANGWVMFTQALQHPSNHDEVVNGTANHRPDLLSLWSGKSSHFKITFFAEDFDFSRIDLAPESKLAIYESSRVAKEFSPAHAIPLIDATLSALDDYYTDMTLPSDYVLDKIDPMALYWANEQNRLFRGPGIYGSVTPSSFTRSQSDSLLDPILGTSSQVVARRTSYRRRNFHQHLPKSGYYSRTGFNMPISWDPSGLEYQNLQFFPLGLVPSSQTYAEIDHEVYDRCLTTNSSATYFGVPLSATFPSRGILDINSNNKGVSARDYYVDRCQSDPIYWVMTKINYELDKFRGLDYFLGNESLLAQENLWKDVSTSYANEHFTETDYENFSFHRGIHQWYNEYATKFNRHNVTYDLIDKDGGPNIISHTYGSIFEGSKFSLDGSASMTASNLSALLPINNQTVFSPAFTSIGTSSNAGGFTLSGQGLSNEFSNAQILRGIEFVQTSGASNFNSFNVIRLDLSGRNQSYLNGNTVIKAKSVNGLPRFKLNLKDHVQENFLIPGHDFSINIKSFVGSEDGLSLGGASIGAFIHTKVENNGMWVYGKDNKWDFVSLSALNINTVIIGYSHIKTFPKKKRGDRVPNSPITLTNCLSSINPVNKNDNPFSIAQVTKEDFEDFIINFNTKQILVPIDYELNVSAHAHRIDQNYIIEIFLLPTSPNLFALYDCVKVRDETLWKMSRPYYQLSSVCRKEYVNLDKEDSLEILNFFNGIQSKSFGSRDFSTSSHLEASGGSRINYREVPGIASIGTGLYDTTLNTNYVYALSGVN